MLQSPSNLWCWHFVGATNINEKILWLKRNATSASGAKEASFWAQSTLFRSVLPSACVIAVLTFSTGSSEAKGRNAPGKAPLGLHLVSGARWRESPRTSAAPAELSPLGCPVPEHPGSPKNTGFDTQPLAYCSRFLSYLCACTISW